MRPTFRVNPRRWLDGWPFKLAALALATVLWFFVRTDESVTGQRTFNVPLTVVGLEPNALASGVPERVEVTIYGPSTRVNTLRAESVDAFLDLQEATGDFSANVSVFPPQGLTSVRTAPSEIIGRVEERATKRVPVRIALYGPTPADALLRTEARPSEVIVTGLASQLGRVQAVVAPASIDVVRSEGGKAVTPYAADADGQPVPEVRLEPNRVRVNLRGETVLHTRRVPLEVTLPDVSPLRVRAQTLNQPDVLLAGLQEDLNPLTRVPASAELPPPRREGEYTQALTLQLPEGVYALETPELSVQLERPPPSGEPDEEPDAPPAERGASETGGATTQ